MHDTAIENMGRKIRSLWVAEQRQFDLRTSGISSGWGAKHMPHCDGGMSRDGRHYKPVWPKIAALCMEYKFEPAILVRAMFYKQTRYAPKPNQATGQYAIGVYRAYTSPTTKLEIKNDLMNEFACDQASSSSEVARQKQYLNQDEQSAWQLTIVSKSISLSPLFRYCVAMNQGWADLADMFRDSATRQYAQQPEAYNEIWKEWIPEDLKKLCGTTREEAKV